MTFTAAPEVLASERITAINFMMEDKPGLLARITAEVLAGRITVPVERTVRLEEVPDALARNASGGARGKTVVRLQPQPGRPAPTRHAGGGVGAPPPNC